jgi:Ala-tRNA(Pro) deacylase
MLAQKLTALLERNRIHYKVVKHPTAYTSQGVAAALHVAGREVAKTVVLKIDGRYGLAVLPAPYHVDLGRFGAAAGAQTVTLASERELATLFEGCELGAEPPFGDLYGLPVWVDATLARDPSIVFNGGSHTDAVRITYQDFVRLAKPTVARFARA